MTTSEKIPYRPLGMIVMMVEALGFQVTHYHEDLVFVEHNAFLLQMGEKGEDVILWFNVDCEPETMDELAAGFGRQAEQLHFHLYSGGTYRLVANEEDETLQIEFLAGEE